MVVIPLVMTSIICGVAKIGGEKDFGRLGLKTFLFYSLTGLLAVATGLFCVNLIEPGQVPDEIRVQMLDHQSDGHSSKIEGALNQADKGWTGILEIFHRMVPANLFKAAVEGQLLGLIFFSLLFGFFITKLPEKARSTQLGFWESLNSLILSITNFIISLAPYGVFGLVTPTLMKVGLETLSVMGSFALTVALGLLVHSLVVLPLLLRFFGKINFVDHYRAMAPAILTAFSTASSSATLPLTMECVNQTGRHFKKVSSFTLPLGATMNMDGTALFECVVVVFLAQLFGIEMGWVTQATVVLMALLTSIGVAGIPSASLVAIIVILQAVGFPEESIAVGVGIVYVVDRILDMTRTAVNALGDSCAAAIIGKSEGETDTIRPSGPKFHSLAKLMKFKLVSDYKPQGDQPEAIDSLVRSLEEDNQDQTLLGVTGSGKTFTMANAIERLQRPALVISHNKTLAAQLYSEFKAFFPENAVEYFVSYYDYYQPGSLRPSTDTFIEKDSSINEEIERLRLAATGSLISRNDAIVIASVSCIYGLGSPDDFRALSVEIEKGEEMGRDTLLEKLIEGLYNRNDVELKAGRFRVRRRRGLVSRLCEQPHKD